MLADEGTTIVKVFLHISPDEQRDGCRRGSTIPRSAGSSGAADLDDRARVGRVPRRPTRRRSTETSTKWAPWYVVPADRKWVRNVAVAELLVDALEKMDPQIPTPEAGIENIVVRVAGNRAKRRLSRAASRSRPK